MAMIHQKDKPTYYKLVNKDGLIAATVSKSRVYAVKKQLEKELNEKLEIVLITEE